MTRITDEHDLWGKNVLATSWASKSMVEQRAGRAGRTQVGKVLRLYTMQVFKGMCQQLLPVRTVHDTAKLLMRVMPRSITSCRCGMVMPDSDIFVAKPILRTPAGACSSNSTRGIDEC